LFSRCEREAEKIVVADDIVFMRKSFELFFFNRNHVII
jgi:hypothetical protein